MSKQKAELQKRRSEIISDFFNLLETSTAKYEFNYEEVHHMELLATDLDHKLELQELSYHEFARVAKQLKSCQQERRVYKDEAEELEPLKNWVQNNQSAFNSIKKLLGEVRKVEEKHAERGYMPRVMAYDEWSGESK